jgi:hypothetical protein
LIVSYPLRPKRPNEGVGDGLLDVFSKSLVLSMRFRHSRAPHSVPGGWEGAATGRLSMR